MKDIFIVVRIKRFQDSLFVNEEIDHANLSKLIINSSGILSSSLSLLSFQWSKIPKIWKNVSSYKSLINVINHLSEYISKNTNNKSDVIHLIKNSSIINKRNNKIRYSNSLNYLSISDLTNYYIINSYNGDLENDVDRSISFIENIDSNKRKKFQDVLDLLIKFKFILNGYNHLSGEKNANQI